MTQSHADPGAQQEETDFGFQRVGIHEKTAKVAEVFSSVAKKYDLMNDLMSGGIHRLWKRFAVELAAIRPGQTVLDLATGTGDLAAKFARLVGKEGLVLATDINWDMLETGRQRLIDQGIVGNVCYVDASAESLPFPDQSVDCITIAFGLRNVTRKDLALREMYRVLRPGGRALIIEFSHVRQPLLASLYDKYSFHVLPRLGQLVAGDGDSYRYLAESIRMHPDQEKLKAMLVEAGFGDVSYYNLTAGVVAIHRGFKF